MGRNSLLKGHIRDHCGIAYRLQLHVSAIFGPLQLHNYKIRLSIKREQVDSSLTVCPLRKLLRKNEEIFL